MLLVLIDSPCLSMQRISKFVHKVREQVKHFSSSLHQPMQPTFGSAVMSANQSSVQITPEPTLLLQASSCSSPEPCVGEIIM